MERTLKLEGLDCANCGEKIRAKTEKSQNIVFAEMNFIKAELKVLLDKEISDDHLINQVQSISNSVESGIKVSIAQQHHSHSHSRHDDHDDHNHFDEHDESSAEKQKKITLISISLVLFALGFLLEDFVAQLVIYGIAYLLVGYRTLVTASKNIIKGHVFDENFLMAIASIGAFAIGEYPEGVAVMLFYEIGEFFQDMAVNNSRRSIKSLLSIRPDHANLIIGDKIKIVSPESVNVGDIIEIRPGERVPLDGVVLSGDSAVDTSTLTGESMTRDVTVDDIVLSGFINQSGIIKVRVTKPFSESTATKLLELVENSIAKKSKTENFITKFARYYTPIVVIAALIIAVIPPLFLGFDFPAWIEKGLIFLVVSCPCALVVSVPLSYFSAIGKASKAGILVKGSNYLEALTRVKAVVFDKTGTLTQGMFTVTKVVAKNSELLEIAALAESQSTHPIAKSIMKYYGKEIDHNRISSYKEIAGKGISAVIDGKIVLVGKKSLFENLPIDLPTPDETCVYVASNGDYLGYIVIADTLKQTSKKTIAELSNFGITSMMLTGDHDKIGNKIAKALKINKVYTELLPADKVSILEKEQKQLNKDEKIVFVGDGINDAPVLARADVGIAMGALGSDSAIEAADVVLMNDDPEQIVKLINISHRTKRIVLQNIIFAIGVKLVIQSLTLFGLFGEFGMWIAVFGDVGVTIIAILNALRLLKK